MILFGDLVVHPGGVLYSDHSDLLAVHLPMKRFLARSFQETGALPLWCPYQYAGLPVLHDPQVAALYPFHLLLLALPEERIGAALSWIVVLHVVIAGAGAHAYARSHGLGRAGAIVAALGTMFAGKWLFCLLDAGQYVLVGLAWVPLVLLALEQAVRRRSLGAASAAGAAGALVIMGTHPQWTAYAGLFVGLWTGATALADSRGARAAGAAIARAVSYGAWAAAVALALAAVQVLPALEGGRESSRALGVPDDSVGASGLGYLAHVVGPTLEDREWELRGGFGVLSLAAAAMAVLVPSRRVRLQGAVCAALLLVAYGGGGEALHAAPIFRYFRHPLRIVVVAALPVALLAGAATEALFAGRPSRLRTGLFAGAIGACLLAITMQPAVARDLARPYWLFLLVAVPAAIWIVARPSGRARQAIWVALFAAEAFAIALPHVRVRAESEVYAPSPIADFLAAHKGGRVLDRGRPNPLGTGDPQALLRGIEAVKGYNPLDVLRYRRFLAFVGDDEHAQVTPLEFYTQPDVPHVFIRNKSLLDLLNVRYLVEPVAPLPGGGQGAGPPWRRVFEDRAATAYDYVLTGVTKLPPFAVYENPDVLPRAFVVPRAAPLPEAGALAALKATDFRETALLEGAGAAAAPGGAFRAAKIRRYEPNRVEIEVADGAAGTLVLADLWYPGWTCTVDGRAAPVYRADYVFRAVALAAGPHEVVFVFAPRSVRVGAVVSGAAAIALLAAAALGDRLSVAFTLNARIINPEDLTNLHIPFTKNVNSRKSLHKRNKNSVVRPNLPKAG